MLVHGHSRGARAALPKSGSNRGELTLGIGTPTAPTFGPPYFDFTGTSWGIRGGDLGSELSYLVGLGLPTIVGTYPVPDGGGPATQTYVSGGIDDSALTEPKPYGFPAPAEEALASIASGLAILNGQLAIQVSVNLLNDTFKATAPDHRLICEVVLGGHAYDFYADEYDTWVGGNAGGLWTKTIYADADTSQVLWDDLRDGISWPFSVELFYWPQWTSAAHTVGNAIATPHWPDNGLETTRLQNNVVLLWPVREQTELDVQNSSSRIAFEGHSRGALAMPQSA